MRHQFRIILPLLIALLWGGPARADWSWNIGYHNPPGANYGLNFMHLWSEWAFEVGIGWIDVTSTNNNNSSNSSNSNSNTTSLHVAGDLNFKYLFGSGLLRPFVQAGVAFGTSSSVGNNTGVSAGTGSGFGGFGLFLMGSPFYVYGGLVLGAGNSSTIQAGLGFDL